jgi:hypothetical protein
MEVQIIEEIKERYRHHEEYKNAGPLKIAFDRHFTPAFATCFQLGIAKNILATTYITALTTSMITKVRARCW